MQYGILKNFAHWVIFWSGSIERFCPQRHVLAWGYWSILSPEVLKHFEPKIFKHCELYQVYILNCFQYFETFWPKTQTRKFVHNFLSQNVSPLSKNWFYFFFSSFDTQKFHHLLGCHAISINFSCNSFLSALRFSNLICQAKSLIRIIVSGSSSS